MAISNASMISITSCFKLILKNWKIDIKKNIEIIAISLFNIRIKNYGNYGCPTLYF